MRHSRPSYKARTNTIIPNGYNQPCGGTGGKKIKPAPINERVKQLRKEYLKLSQFEGDFMKLPNGYGSVIKLSKRRRKPFAARVTTCAS